MKLSKISLAVVALAGVASTSAFAQVQLKAGAYSAANAVNIYVSGATAQDKALDSAILSLCNAGTFTKYTASNQSVILCTPTAAYGLPVGKSQLAVYKHSVGGSGNGVAPVNNSTPLPFLDLTKINTTCPAATAAGTQISCSLVADTSTLTTNAVAPIGISDVEPSFFGAKAGTYNNLQSVSLATVIFGIPVTTNVYTALQTAQSLTAGATDAANIPSLSSGQVSTLFTQEGQTWSTVAGVSGLADDNVYVARRVDGSGTQKTYEAVIVRTANTTSTGKSCYGQLTPFLSGIEVVDNNAANNACDGTNAVINNSGSGQVAFCLAKLNASGKAAIGTLTTESVSTADWKHVRLDGLLPNYANVKNGSYAAYGDAALNTRVSPGIGTDHTNFKTKFFGAFGAQPTLHPAFGSTTTDAGKAGLIELNSVTGLTTGNPYSRQDASGNADNCLPARLSN
jgi:hypothetical protein